MKKTSWVCFFAFASVSVLAAERTSLPTKAIHPLDPLTASEVESTLAILKKQKKINDKTLFPYLMLKEPPKKEVLAFTPGKAFRREAFAILVDRDQRKMFEVTVDLRKKQIAEDKEIPGAQPSVLLSEFEAAPPILRADPRFKAAMERRGIKNLDDVAIDVWSYGSPTDEASQKVRLLRTITYLKGKGKNFYARPIDGFTAIINMDERKVDRIIDTKVYPLPTVASELDEKSIGPKQAALKPLKISQPQGASFKVIGNEVRWQNWSFHFTMHPREGLVLQLVKYNDHGKWRSMLYRGSLAEMMVPYGHTDEHWTYRAAFDEGEYGIGRYSGSLEVGTDVPDNAQLFDALFVNDFGKPSVTKNAVALYERDGGLLWKHFDMYHGGNYSRRARDLVLGFITTISNYDYGINWVFHEDGTLEMESQLTGIMLAKGTDIRSMDDHGEHGAAHDSHPDMKFGHLVAPYVVAPHHQHFFNFRLDLDVDGAENNSVVELNSQALPAGPDNPASNGFTMTETPLKTELAAIRDLSYSAQRKWKVFNPATRNRLGYRPGMILVPGENAAPYLLENSPLLTRGGFISHPVWFTQERDTELYAAGPYPTQRASADGLAVWTQQDRSLESKDVVLWYTFCVTHAPRPEEWPVMSTHKTGFKLIPAGFFDQNPALDVAK